MSCDILHWTRAYIWIQFIYFYLSRWHINLCEMFVGAAGMGCAMSWSQCSVLLRSLSKRVPVRIVTEHHTRPTHLSCKISSHLHLGCGGGGGDLESVETWPFGTTTTWVSANPSTNVFLFPSSLFFSLLHLIPPASGFVLPLYEKLEQIKKRTIEWNEGGLSYVLLCLWERGESRDLLQKKIK